MESEVDVLSPVCVFSADGGRSAAAEEKQPRDEHKPSGPQSKGKKNAYSNSAQKMTCPFCPRVFPWASSLQRHMLTHTGKILTGVYSHR